MDTSASPPGLSSADARRLEAFASVAAAVAHSTDLDAALSQALHTTMDALGLEAGGIYFVDEETGGLIATPHHRGLPADYPAKVARFRRGEGPIGRALDSVTPVALRDIAALEGVRDATRQIGLRSLAFVPAVRARPRGRDDGGGRVSHPRVPARGAAGAGRGGGHPRRGHRERPPGRPRAAPPRAGAGAVGDRPRGGRGARSRRGLRHHRARSRAPGRGRRGADPARRRAGSAHRRLARRRRPRRARPPSHPRRHPHRHPAAARRAGHRPPFREPRAPSWSPLHAGGRIAGGLVVVRTAAPAEDEAALLTAFGRRSAVALGKVEARQTEARRASQLALLAGASEIAASTLDLDVMLGAVARYIQQSFGYYSVSIYVVDRAARSSVLAGSAGVAAQVMPLAHRIDFGRGMIGWVAEHGQYLLANDVRQGAALLRRPHDGHPLRAGGAGAAGRGRGGGDQRGERPGGRLRRRRPPGHRRHRGPGRLRDPQRPAVRGEGPRPAQPGDPPGHHQRPQQRPEPGRASGAHRAAQRGSPAPGADGRGAALRDRVPRRAVELRLRRTTTRCGACAWSSTRGCRAACS